MDSQKLLLIFHIQSFIYLQSLLSGKTYEISPFGRNDRASMGF